MRYQVVVKSAAGVNSGKGKYRRPVHVRVMDVTKSEWHALRGLNDGLIAEWRNVDSRYKGLRSECGRALRAARELAKQLNDQITNCVVI